jgi:hypothetical protein
MQLSFDFAVSVFLPLLYEFDIRGALSFPLPTLSREPFYEHEVSPFISKDAQSEITLRDASPLCHPSPDIHKL